MQLRLKYLICLRKADWQTARRAHTLHSAILRCALFVLRSHRCWGGTACGAEVTAMSHGLGGSSCMVKMRPKLPLHGTAKK